MFAIYVAQHKYFSEEYVDRKIGSAGRYLIKIGRAYNLSDRVQTINGRHDVNDWRYMGTAGWKFICFREVAGAFRLKPSEKDSHQAFKQYRLPWDSRKLLTDGRHTGFELFVGGPRMIEEIRAEFVVPACGHPELQHVSDWLAPDFHTTTAPYCEPHDVGPRRATKIF